MRRATSCTISWVDRSCLHLTCVEFLNKYQFAVSSLRFSWLSYIEQSMLERAAYMKSAAQWSMALESEWGISGIEEQVMKMHCYLHALL